MALDEGLEADEAPPRALAARLALHVTAPEGARPPPGLAGAAEDAAAARAGLAEVTVPDAAREAICALAERLGVPGMDAPILALRAARAGAALRAADEVEEEDLAAAAALVLVPRATRMPAPEEDAQDAPRPIRARTRPIRAIPGTGRMERTDPCPTACWRRPRRCCRPACWRPWRRAPPWARRARGRGPRGSGGADGPCPLGPAGSPRTRGSTSSRRFVPPRPGRRSAAPGPGEDRAVVVRPSDIHLARAQERAERLLIFVVDASGSAAAARLAEAKGAVERLLAEAYASRDRVALVTFRGAAAEIALPPTRSLVQAKRRLAGLPGGGGTPLAAGLATALALARRMSARGLSPSIALLTDGRANVALDGRGDRAAAGEDAARLAALIRADRVPALVLDTGVRPSPALEALAAAMGARHLALPRAPDGALTRALAGLA